MRGRASASVLHVHAGMAHESLFAIARGTITGIMLPRSNQTRGPNRQAALAQYRQRADVYDWELALFEPLLRDAIALLDLQEGDVVLDVGCGTGLSLPGLVAGVGKSGHVVGIEQSPEMIELARERARQNDWQQVQLVNSPVESADIDTQADAALFHFTHDILRRPQAIANVLSCLRPGARVVASGLKWAPPGLAWGVNFFVLPAALRSVTSLDGMVAPWQLLQDQLGALQVQHRLMGGCYIAHGSAG